MDRQNFEMLDFFIKNEALALEEIQTRFNTSRVTIAKNIREINKELDGVAKINVNKSKFYLTIEDYAAVVKIQTNFLKQDLDFNDPNKRQAAILQKLLMQNQKYIALDDLASELSVSHGTVNNDLKALKELVAFYGVTVQARPNNGIRLNTEHLYSYAVVARNIVAKYYDFDLILNSIFDSELTGAVKEVDDNNDTVTMVKRNISIIVWLRKYGIQINKPCRYYHEVVRSEMIRKLKKVISNIVSETLNDGEWEFILYPFNIKKLSASDDELIEYALNDVGELMKNVFPVVKEKLDVNLDFDRLLIELRYHLLFLINRAIYGIKAEGVISSSILNKYPVAAELAQETLMLMTKETGIKFNKNELSYLGIYFQMELEEYMSSPVIYRIAIVKPISNGMRKFIIEQLKELLNENLKIDLFNSQLELETSSNKYLLIFSNSLPIENKLVNKSPVIRLNSVFNQGTLRERLQISLVDEAINNGFCRFDVTKFTGKDDSYTERVKQLIVHEISIGQLNEEFLNDWIKRERLSSNILSSGVALPHVIDKSGLNRILVTVGLFNKPVTYDSRKVKVVFLVAIPYKLDANLSRILAQVYDLIRIIATNGNIFNNLKNYDQNRGLIQLMEAI
ncbi:HTH domain-containing protein [Lactobacillus sp. UCMA15818]|uniref:BglG family transcription antiterminator n=1 Tax=Lactobacillus sp. UCMA15818 TaxID=2583394 RepID=UPI0025AEF447|nr:HTH domain-containing protein [Lactobacillus sp. UCMA15818]MDN2453204.1 HTH domain-containing protein [Lactobacillus sp. UCMA15818]